MVFKTAPYYRQLIHPIPECRLVGDFVMERGHGIWDYDEKRPSVVDAKSGKGYTMSQIQSNVDALSRSLGDIMGWKPNEGSPEEKVVGILSVNTVDFLTISWAAHRLGGICLLLHPTSAPSDIAGLMMKSRCKVVFTSTEVLPLTKGVCAKIGLDKIYMVDEPSEQDQQIMNGAGPARSVVDLVIDGKSLPGLESVQLGETESKHRIAYLCPTSGTSGVSHLAEITHYNMMANILQLMTFELANKRINPEIALGILPLSHAYGLVLLQALIWRGDCAILHPRFDMQATLASIQRYRIETLYLVPAIITAFVKNPILFKLADLSSVKSVVSGSAPLSAELTKAINDLRPNWSILGGYGLTESSVVVAYTSRDSIAPGSVGSLLPGVEVQILAEDGSEVANYGVSGDLYLRSPSMMKGYIGESSGKSLAFTSDGWLKTGDVACVKKTDKGDEHLFIVDRKKDVMKVKGVQVAPAEIEAQLLNHPAVDEVAVVATDDDESGERPFAFVIRSKKVMTDVEEKTLRKTLSQHVQDTLSEPFWLRQNIKFMDEFPKTLGGKPLKFKLKQMVAASA